MKIQLSKDPLFQVQDSPIKAIKSKEIQRKKVLRAQRLNPTNKKYQSKVQIIDPLPNELRQYRTETTYRKSVQTSRASESLKKYIIQQEQNLRCLRLQRLENEQCQTPKKKKLHINLSPVHKDEQKQNKQIHIPKIQDLFKNQSKQFLLYENRLLYNRLGKMINSMNQNISKFKAYSFFQGGKDKDPSLHSTGGFNPLNFLDDKKNVPNEEDQEIDKKIDRNLEKSQNLQDKLYKQKRQMSNHKSTNQSGTPSSADMSFFLRVVQKPKKKVQLRGVKSYTFKDGNKKLQITPATGLLFQLHKLSDNKQKKQYELAGLLKNSFQNRDSILSEKSNFYDQETSFANLSPSSQFKLRHLMNKKLEHRLELSKEQVNKFIDYLSQIKDYHVILNDNILQILKQVRKTLLSGKVMKILDLQNILKMYDRKDLMGHPNGSIVQKLSDMMI